MVYFFSNLLIEYKPENVEGTLSLLFIMNSQLPIDNHLFKVDGDIPNLSDTSFWNTSSPSCSLHSLIVTTVSKIESLVLWRQR